MNNIKMLHGIDSLYYFCESNENYDNLFLDILDQIEDKKGLFEKKDIEYENSDINIHIKDTPFDLSTLYHTQNTKSLSSHFFS